MNIEAAANYHERHKPQALILRCGNRTLFERYDGGFSAAGAHALYSGTKSFWGVTAVLAQRERLLSLDETVWQGATIRELLNLTAGVPFGGLGSAVPTYEKALASERRAAPGSRFTYGGIPLQIFGAIFSERLKPLHMTPHEYLHARVLDPNGIAVASWRTLKDGTQPLPTGASLTAENWARYGSYVSQSAGEFAECFKGSLANPRYGLGWWLAPPASPAGLFYASGSGGQAMYVVPSQELVAVRFGNGGSFNHEVFLKRLFGA
ncbi:MAG TPA: serine hydrolase domain-containing protein [Candidatus Baltobacteraceae bacterium]|nr:serine hydrolase domain-containing protein [Candidatus Baltobacteraceae bacterium]